jgi:UDP-glucose 4-epimerase
MRKRYLITGGAGFVGSHVTAALLARDAECVVFDNLSTGHRDAVMPGARLVEGDLADRSLLDQTIADGPWDAVFHFASRSLVGESMRKPFLYLQGNVENGMRLIEACTRHGVKHFVFSSTAALFGSAPPGLIDEQTPINPASPYGESKWMQERVLHWAYQVHGMRSACLRYFNAAGSDPLGRIGEDHRPETHLIPLVIDAGLGRREMLEVFGRDFATPDGSAVRDYIHVSDLAEAHLRVLDHMADGSIAYNLGTGSGHSVMDVIGAVERVLGWRVPRRYTARRAGDPAFLVASSTKMTKETHWRPTFSNLDEIVRTTLAWREAHPNGYAA